MNRQAVPLEKIVQNLKIQAMKPPAEAAAAVITMMRRAGAQVMRDPVVAGDGFTYERDALERWLTARGAVSPVTGAPLPHPNITPNQARASNQRPQSDSLRARRSGALCVQTAQGVCARAR